MFSPTSISKIGFDVEYFFRWFVQVINEMITKLSGLETKHITPRRLKRRLFNVKILLFSWCRLTLCSWSSAAASSGYESTKIHSRLKKNLQEQLSALTFKFKINWKRKIGINKHSKSVPIQNVSYIKSIVHKVVVLPTTTSTYVREVCKVTDGKSDLKWELASIRLLYAYLLCILGRGDGWCGGHQRAAEAKRLK